MFYHSGTNSVLQQQDENYACIVPNFINDPFSSILTIMVRTAPTVQYGTLEKFRIVRPFPSLGGYNLIGDMGFLLVDRQGWGALHAPSELKDLHGY